MPLETPPSPATRRIHTAIAIAILLVFWGMIAASFRDELRSLVPRFWQQQNRISSNVAESRFFRVRNNAGASHDKVSSIISILETDYRTILHRLNQEPGEPISILITPGSGPALAIGGQLILLSDGDNINLDTVPPSLIMLAQGTGLDSSNLFLEGGYAIYLSEEIDRADGLGQPSDAWVLLLQQQGALLPFEQAWQASLPSDVDGAYDLGRALLQGGSFIRWIAETYGTEAVQDLRHGQRLETVTGLYFDEAERQWLNSLKPKNITISSCQTATLGQPWLQPLCERLTP